MANGHGGKRQGAGRPKKPLVDKLYEGTTKKHKPKVLNIPADDDYKLEYPKRLDMFDGKLRGVPTVEEVWNETVTWLEKTKCLHLINPAFIDEYAILKTRFYECEKIVSNTHPIYNKKDGDRSLMMNPAIDASLKYLTKADIVWGKIWNIVAANSEVYFGDDPNADVMAFLLKNKPER